MESSRAKIFHVIILIGGKTSVHTYPAPMVDYLAQGKFKHLRGDVINIFSLTQSLVESNNGDEYFVENIGNKPAILYVVAGSTVGLLLQLLINKASPNKIKNM